MTPQTDTSPQPMPAQRRPQLPSRPPAPKKRRMRPLGIFLMLGCFGVFAGLFLVFVFIVAVFSNPGPVLTGDHTILRLNIDGEIVPYEPPGPFEFLLGQGAPQMHEFLDMIEAAAKEPNIEGILLEIGPNVLSWAQSEELYGALKGFSETGKWIVAYGEAWNEQDYFLASIANEVFMTPEGLLEVDGFVASATYYADLLQRYGVNVHVEAIGEFKSMADGYRYSQGTDPVRIATRALLDNRQKAFVEKVSERRDLEPQKVRALLETTLHSAADGKDAGLVDQLLYRSEMEEFLRKKVGGTVQLVDRDTWWRGNQNPGRNAVAVLYATGTISSGHSGQGMFGDKILGSFDFINEIRQVAADPRVKAAVLRIDSPGGSVLASDVIWKELKLLAEKKPVIASMGSVAASGGYYLAMACDTIVAQPNTITGSIGIVTMRMDFSQLYEQLAVNVDVIKTSQNADFWEPSRALTQAEKAGLAARTLEAYRSFVTKAATARNLEYNDMDRAARGRPWSGSDALDLGLVDHLGGLDAAIRMAAEKAGLTRYSVIRFPTEDQWSLVDQNLLASSEMQVVSSLGQLIPAELRMLGNVVDRRRRVHVLAISPYSIDIQ